MMGANIDHGHSRPENALDKAALASFEAVIEHGSSAKIVSC
jgi:hypothetical protein